MKIRRNQLRKSYRRRFYYQGKIHKIPPVLLKIRYRESRNQYDAVNKRSGAAGAYQFMKGTWNVTASRIGRKDLVDKRPNEASKRDQDWMALQLYEWLGTAPWGGPNI